MTTEAKMRTITLTGRPPVKIKEDDWPVIAVGSFRDHDNQYEFQANRTWKTDIRVRQHADGRAIVYGVDAYDTRFQGAHGWIYKVGHLLQAGEDVATHIRVVGDELIARGADRSHVQAAADQCVANLPPEEI